MKKYHIPLIVSLFLLLNLSFTTNTFKEEQLKFQRVRQAYKEKEAAMEALLKSKQIDRKELTIYLRAFKLEKKIELWGKNKNDETFQLIKTYKICRTSGELGPKRKKGDLQIPEGFYHINRFNPYSNFYLSLGINYPNKSDRILGNKSNLGGDIFIHGACVTIGCLPITDAIIKELYIFCVEARNNNQTNIPVTIFPFELKEQNLDLYLKKYQSDKDKINL